MSKRIISVVLALVLCFCMGFGVQAEESVVQPRYQYANTVATTLTTSNGDAVCSATLNGLSSVTKIRITMSLQKKTLFWWSDVETWTYTKSDSFACLCQTVSVESGTYRVEAIYNVYSGSASEEITAYSPEKKF